MVSLMEIFGIGARTIPSYCEIKTKTAFNEAV